MSAIVRGADAGLSLWTAPRWWVKSVPNTIVTWLRSDLGITLNGSDVLTWADQAGSHDVSQAVAANQMLYSATGGPGGHPYIEGDGVQEYLQGLWVQAQPTTLFMVVMPSVTDKNFVSIADGSASQTRRIFTNGADLLAAYASGADVLTRAAESSAWHYATAVFNGVSSSLSVDGGTADTGDAGNLTTGGLTLGARGDLAFFGDSRIAEVIELVGVASAETTNNIEHYFRTRYSL